MDYIYITDPMIGICYVITIFQTSKDMTVAY